MSPQLAVRLPEQLARSIDELVERGQFATRADLVREAIMALIEREQRLATGEAIANGYRRIPQTDEELDRATAAAVRSIHEEPW